MGRGDPLIYSWGVRSASDDGELAIDARSGDSLVGADAPSTACVRMATVAWWCRKEEKREKETTSSWAAPRPAERGHSPAVPQFA